MKQNEAGNVLVKQSATLSLSVGRQDAIATLPQRVSLGTISIPQSKISGRNRFYLAFLIGAGCLTVGFMAFFAWTNPAFASIVNNVSVPVATQENLWDAMLEVYRQGLAMGNDPTRFSIIGDCQNVSSYFLAMFDRPGDFSLGDEYTYLQPTIDYYKGSYSRQSLAVKGGFNVAAVLSPLRADPKACNKNESPLDCELRVWKPSVVFVSMETWWSEKLEQEYDKYMRRVIERILASGAIPIIATKADNLEGDHGINATIAQIAYDYDIPLWNFWAAVQPLPNHGLWRDGFHLTFARNFFDDPARMKNAWPWRNLTALQALDVVRRALMNEN